MNRILITGCGGQLGRALTDEYEGEAALILTDTADAAVVIPGAHPLDITDIDEVTEFVTRERPTTIINCAAMTNVDGCEANPDAAYRVNALGTRNLAIAAENIGAKLIHISTDYVFSGTDPNPLPEYEEPDPLSVYGRTKLAGERYVERFCRRWFILRTAWLYGEGKNFVRTMLSLAEDHDEVKVVDDQIGSPTSAAELARMIKRLEPTMKYGIYHTTCEGQVSWADFARYIFELAGKKTKVTSISSSEYKAMNPKSAKRPAFSILAGDMLRLNGFPPMADWKDAIREYMLKEAGK